MRKCIVGLAQVLSAMPATAQTIDERTKCAVVSTIYNAPQVDLLKVRAIGEYAESVFSALDHKNAAEGRPQIIARMSADGLLKTLAMIPAWCNQHPEETLWQSVINVYEGLK
jgi:hypothetical protein